MLGFKNRGAICVNGVAACVDGDICDVDILFFTTCAAVYQVWI